ncbi:MAG: DUF2779 domain-containing protein, partial [Proteobacteria bacterium]
MPNKKFLSKSRFKIGHECPRKLYYIEKEEYPNVNLDNAFLEALAEGGFQVGAMARILHPGGIEIETLDKEEAIQKTSELMSQENAIIFEGAFRFQNLFIRADIVEKRGRNIVLSEVKAKSYDPAADQFYNKTLLKKGVHKINSDWEPYLIDVAFQAFVIKNAFPELEVTSNLMLANKSVRASVEGLNQLFLLTQEDGKTAVRVKAGVTKESLGVPLLIKLNVQDEVALLHESQYQEGKSFTEYVTSLSKIYSEGL